MQPTLIIAAVAGFAALPMFASAAWAQANRTFVSGQGSDSNPCSLSAPCRSFAQAITQTNAGGEITVLDSAGYGSVTITKSVSIINEDGVEAGVTTSSAVDGITVTVGASDVVNLRGLTLVGGGAGTDGIVFNNLGTLNIQNCVIRGFTESGLALLPTGTSAFNVSDTIASNNSINGVVIQPSGSGTVTALFNQFQAIGSGNAGFVADGSFVIGTIDVTIANSTASNNGAFGIGAGSANGKAVTELMVTNTVVSNNAVGVSEDGAPSATYLAKSTIAGNTTAFTVTNNGALFSFGDNYVKSNTSDGGTITLVATK